MPARKKDPSVRARRNRASTAATLLPSAKAPRVPPLPQSRSWRAQTAEWWRDVWTAPMSAEYHESDRHQLLVLAALIDDFFDPEITQTARTRLAAEIRQQRMAFGLTPLDRRRLEWSVATAEDAKARGAERRGRQGVAQPKPSDDPRRALSVVNGDGKGSAS